MEDGHGDVVGSREGLLHEAVGTVEGAEHFHCAAKAGLGACDELGGGEEVGVKEFDFVAAEFVDVASSDGGGGLGKDLDGCAVDKPTGVDTKAAVEDGFELVGEEGGEVVVHAVGLIA